MKCSTDPKLEPVTLQWSEGVVKTRNDGLGLRVRTTCSSTRERIIPSKGSCADRYHARPEDPATIPEAVGGSESRQVPSDLLYSQRSRSQSSTVMSGAVEQKVATSGRSPERPLRGGAETHCAANSRNLPNPNWKSTLALVQTCLQVLAAHTKRNNGI